MKNPIYIIGAGPAGITTGYLLSKSGYPVVIYEASSEVGGMSRTIQLWNQSVDIGPHRFFSTDNRVNQIWLELAGKDYRMVNRKTRIYYKGKLFDYPLRAPNALWNLGIFETARCILGFLAVKISPAQKQDNFESWVTTNFGKRLYEIFFKDYTEKLWGISCKNLHSDFAAQRIKKLSLWEACVSSVFKKSRKRHKTLVDQFAYPLNGSGMIYERMAEYIKQHGGKVFLNTPVDKVIVKDKQITGITLKCGEMLDASTVVSTMPITLMISGLSDVPAEISEAAKSLRYRNTIIVYLNIDSDNLFSDQWLYINSNEVKTGRITNFRNWGPELFGNQNTSILAMEYWCYDQDTICIQEDAEIIKTAKKEISASGLIGKAKIIDAKVFRVPKCYPVYENGYKEKLKKIENYLRNINGLYPIGRYGSFKYNNQDHSILMGLLASENISGSATHDLWAVNTDYDNYQERSRITDSGLVYE
jgi:protoporphyrinogen oxidase